MYVFFFHLLLFMFESCGIEETIYLYLELVCNILYSYVDESIDAFEGIETSIVKMTYLI